MITAINVLYVERRPCLTNTQCGRSGIGRRIRTTKPVPRCNNFFSSRLYFIFIYNYKILISFILTKNHWLLRGWGRYGGWRSPDRHPLDPLLVERPAEDCEAYNSWKHQQTLSPSSESQCKMYRILSWVDCCISHSQRNNLAQRRRIMAILQLALEKKLILYE